MASEKKKTPAAKRPLSPEEQVASVTIADVYKAAKQLEGVAKRTKLIESSFFSSVSGNSVWLKPENLQNTGSFKLRGAYNKISQL